MKDVQIQTIIFRPDGFLEITYAETRDQTDVVMMAKIVGVDRAAVVAQVDVLEDMAIELVDEILIMHRNPPRTLGGR